MVARAESVMDTRDAILAAAVEEFWDKPATDVSLDAIASRAGVSTRTVLRHFGSKEEVFEAAGERERLRIARQREAVPPGDNPEAVRILVDHYEEMGDRVLRLLAEEHRMAGLREVVDIGRSVHRDWCRRVFAGALAPLTGVDRDRRLAQLVAVCDVYTWKLLRRDEGLSRRQTERALIELLEPLTEVQT